MLKPETFVERSEFLEFVFARHKSCECVVWPFSRTPQGYGYYQLGVAAHSAMCRLVNGDPPSHRHDAAHSCGVRSCINPLHLSWKTRRENAADMLKHGTSQEGERHAQAKLNSGDVQFIRASQLRNAVLADMFGVSANHVRNIRARKCWTHLW